MFKAFLKNAKKAVKEHSKLHDKTPRKRVYVIDFAGNLRAEAVESLREEVTAVLCVATPEDEVVVKLDSGGGVVHGYGLGAIQLSRFREKKDLLQRVATNQMGDRSAREPSESIASSSRPLAFNRGAR